MRFVIVFLIGVLSVACSDDSSSLPADRSVMKFSLATRGIYNFTTYIRTLEIYAFRQNETGDYVFYDVLADLNAQDINKLEQGSAPGNTYTESRLLNTELTIGNYRFYFVGNAQAESEGGLQKGVTLPADVWLTYPDDGLYWPYFLGSTAAEVNKTTGTVPVELHHVVSRLYLKISEIPQQIDTLRMSVKNVAHRISLEGEYSDPGNAVEEIFQMKNENLYEQSTVLFDLYTFPSLGGESEIELTFHARSGEERTRLVPVELLPDRYVNLSATVNNSYGALLSFDFTCVYFFAWDWRDIGLPDFSLMPQK